jgi:hypothetical protein
MYNTLLLPLCKHGVTVAGHAEPMVDVTALMHVAQFNAPRLKQVFVTEELIDRFVRSSISSDIDVGQLFRLVVMAGLVSRLKQIVMVSTNPFRFADRAAGETGVFV